MSQPTPILFIIPNLTAGGSERVMTVLLRNLDREKFKVSLAVVDMKGQVFLDQIPSDVEVIDLNCDRVRYAIPRLISLIWRKRPKLVFSTLGYLNLAVAIFRPLLPRSIKFVARESSVVSEVIKRRRFPTLWTWAYKMFYGRFDVVICQSKYMRDDLIANFGLSPHLTRIIHNPVEIEKIRELAESDIAMVGESKNSAEKWLVSAGRLVPVKGFELLLTAVAKCLDLPIRLLVVGDGPLRLQLERLRTDLGLEDRVTFVGFQKNPYSFFARADALVLSSHYEGFPNVVLEAMTCGTPVISTPAPGGVIELLTGVSGCYLAKEVSSDSLAEVIRDWYKGSRKRLAPDCVEAYSVSKIAKQYEDTFLGCLGKERHG